MDELEGIKIISDSSRKKARTLEFVILSKEQKAAIDTLIHCVDMGSEVTLADNRDNREGSISIRVENGEYFISGGGHGFSIDWRATSRKDILWLIKVTTPFNLGECEGNSGCIEIYS